MEWKKYKGEGMKKVLWTLVAVVLLAMSTYVNAQVVYQTIQLKRGTAAEWIAENPVLASGEPGFESDTNTIKIGDGLSHWNDLAYVQGLSGSTMVYPSVGIPKSLGTAWDTSYLVGTGANNIVQLDSGGNLPPVSALYLTNFPTLNQNTTGTAAGLGAAYVDWNATSGGAFIQNKPDLTLLAPLANPTFTGTVTTPAPTLSNVTGTLQCLHVNSSGVISGTGSDCGSSDGSGANSAGYYLVTQSTNEPANAVDLGLLTTGLLKISVTGGVATPSTASPTADYQPYNANTAVGPGTSTAHHVAAFSGTDGKTLEDTGKTIRSDSQTTPSSGLYNVTCINSSGASVTCPNVGNTTYQTPLTFSNSITNASGTVSLTNDSASPGVDKVYGTNGSGVRGWISKPTSVSTASASNLVVKTNATNPTYQIDITADEIIVQDSSGNPYRLASFSHTVDILVSGVGGRATGTTETASTWYYLFAIYGTSGNHGLISSSASPTLPAGYTYKALVGMAYNDGSSNFVPFWQHGKRIDYYAYRSAVSGGYASTYTSVSLSALVPSNAVAAKLRFQTWGTSTFQSYLSINGSNDYFNAYNYSADNQATAIDTPLPTAQTIWYKAVTGANGTKEINIDVMGFELP